MRRCLFHKFFPIVTALLAGLAFAILTSTLFGQSAEDSGLSYDLTREVTLSGTVSSVLLRPAPGMIMGSHLLLTTAMGTVDASLGRWGLRGDGALSTRMGEQIEVTGVMKVLREKPVLLVRTVKAGGNVYTIRNKYGIPMSPQARERAAEKEEQQ